MNRDIAPNALTSSSTWYLENFTQSALGEGVLRYGVRNFGILSALNDGFIMRAFPYRSSDGAEQILCYTNSFIIDTSANNVDIVGTNVSLETANVVQYRDNTFVKIVYDDVDGNRITDRFSIRDVNSELNNLSFILDDAFLEDVTVISISFSKGQVYLFDINSKFSNLVYDNLRTDCIPRAVHFTKKLIFCNGLDRLFEWNGIEMKLVSEYVKEQASNIAVTEENKISFRCVVNADKYTDVTHVFINNERMGITARNINGENVVLTLDQNVGAVPGEIFFESYPPRCNFLCVAQDRLWGLGEGAAGIEPRSNEESLKVYYTDRPNYSNKWYDEEDQDYKTIDLSNKFGFDDNLESISQIGKNIVFLGRKRTQVYSGSVNDDTFSWTSTLSVGTLHGDLVWESVNDLFFVSANGLHSFSTLNIGNQLAASSVSSINSLLTEYILQSFKSNIRYRSSFFYMYSLGHSIGIRIGESNVIHSLFSSGPYFTSIFSGAFSCNHISQFDNRLFLFSEKNINVYSDGMDGSDVTYMDLNDPIFGSWYQPFEQGHSRDFFYQRVSCLADYDNIFTEGDNGIYIKLYNETPTTSNIEKKMLLIPRQDTLIGNVNDITLAGEFKTLSRKLKTIGSNSWMYFVAISGGSSLKVRGVTFYGRRCR